MIIFIGTDLPFGVTAGTSVRTEQSFAIVGGYSRELQQEHDTILLYQPQDNTWMDLHGRLKTPRSAPIAIVVDISIFPQCPGYKTTTTTTTTVSMESDAAGLSATALTLMVTVVTGIFHNSN